MATKPGDTVERDFTTHSPTTGAATDADSLPTGVLVRNNVDTAESVTVANKETGVYSASVLIPANWVAGDDVQIRIHATVGGVADKEVVWGATLDSKRNADLQDLSAADVNTEADAALADVGLTTVVTGRIDAAISTRSTYDGSDTTGTTTLLARLTVTRAGNLDNLDATVSSRLASAAYVSPPTATEIADAALARSVASVEATAGKHTLAGLILLVTNSDTTTNAGFATAFQTDGLTEFAQYTVTADAAAEAITSIKG